MSTEPIDLDAVQVRATRLAELYPSDSATGVVVHKDVPSLILELDDARNDVEALEGDLSAVRTESAELNRKWMAAEARLAETRRLTSRLMDKLDETASGLGDWHDATEYLTWARSEVREAWLAAGGGQ